MPSTTYPTRQPDTTAAIEAAMANREIARTALLNVRVKQYTPAGMAEIVGRMSEAMRLFGPGMTEDDLKADFSDDEIKHCAKPARDRAMQRARLN
jgi:hypothetical protein